MPLPPPMVMPEAIAREVASGPPGEVTIVDFADFECPFCRLNHASLTEAIARSGKKVHVVRKHVPLPMHTFALGAARLAVCAEQMGKGEAVAEALFGEEDLSPPNLKRLGLAQGLDAAALDTCLLAVATQDRINRDTALFTSTKGERDGLPCVWINGRKFMGAQQPETLEAALREK